MEKGENLGTAASREVKEETGIDAKPLGLVTLRHTHPHPELSFPCKSIKTFAFQISENEFSSSMQ